MKGKKDEKVKIDFDIEGIEIQEGQECYQGKVGKRNVIDEMGKEEGKGEISVQIEKDEGEEKVDRFIEELRKIVESKKRKKKELGEV